MMKLNILGAGKVGRTLGKLFHTHQLLTLQAVYNQTPASAQNAVDFIGAGQVCASIQDLPPADITIIAVPDQHIEAVAHAWPGLPGNTLFHVSGSQSSSLLACAKVKGVHVASIHPLKSFADPQQSYDTFAGTFCAMEGDEEALNILSPLFETLGAKTGTLSPQSKALYHAACVMACGGLTGLYASCEQLLIEAGLCADAVNSLLGPYMKHTIDNNTRLGSQLALTGPVARGDHATIHAHEAVLSGDVLAFYRVLTKIQEDLL